MVWRNKRLLGRHSCLVRLSSHARPKTDLYEELKNTDGWVHPESIKEFADLIRDLDPASILLKNVDYLQGIPENQQEQWIRDCAARLKEVILDCAEKGRGILHFH